MNQTRLVSLIETLVNTAIGFVVSYLAWPPIAAMTGLEYTGGQHAAVTLAFTVLSVARGYVIRRFFNTYLHRLAVWVASILRRKTMLTTTDKLLLILKTLWRIPAAALALLPFASVGAAIYLHDWRYLLAAPVTPVLFWLLMRPVGVGGTHIGQEAIPRYRLPSWLAWAETPDEYLPGGMYEKPVAWIYRHFGAIASSMYWVLLRNVGGGVMWGRAVPLGPIYPANIDFNSKAVLKAIRLQHLTQRGLTPQRFFGVFVAHWEVTKDFYGTKSGRVDENWRTCDYVAKLEVALVGFV